MKFIVGCWKAISAAWRAVVREVVWTLDLDDGSGSPALTKGIAVATGVVAVVSVFAQIHVSGTVVALFALAAAIAFGRSTYLKWLGRNTWKGWTKDETEKSDATVTLRQEILKRRQDGKEDGTEPT